MTARSLFFADSNVLLYAIDRRDRVKQRGARDWLDALWKHGAGRLSWQVLNEFYANATGKIGAPRGEVRQTLESFAWWEPVGFSLGLVQRAWYWIDAARIPYWDSLILAAAERAGCAYLLTEDFQAGRKFADLAVVNPFRSKPGEFGLS
ncbi:MAG: PIN domain-containing protein [Bryobacteraceae bacterium]|jgi:predicted nucleic acid-binding protein